jgi:ADP-heptose:LPS heptosyltransferase
MEADIQHEYHGVKGLNALYRRLHAKKFTAIADLHGVLRSGYLRMRFNLDHYRVEHINKHRTGKRRLTAINNKQRVQQPTSFHNYMDVLARLGYPIKPDFQSIFPPTGGNLRLLSPQIGEKKGFQQWIGIAPFAAHQGKIYPPRLMEQVVNHLLQLYANCRIFFFGSSGQEQEIIKDWCNRYPRCTFASPLCNGIDQELILMSHLNVMLSMDSANMHLASLTATPVVSVWGATHPYAGFMGWNQTDDRIVQLDLDCRPCSIFGKKPCLRGDYACLNNISPELIVEKINHIINP